MVYLSRYIERCVRIIGNMQFSNEVRQRYLSCSRVEKRVGEERSIIFGGGAKGMEVTSCLVKS